MVVDHTQHKESRSWDLDIACFVGLDLVSIHVVHNTDLSRQGKREQWEAVALVHVHDKLVLIHFVEFGHLLSIVVGRQDETYHEDHDHIEEDGETLPVLEGKVARNSIIRPIELVPSHSEVGHVVTLALYGVEPVVHTSPTVLVPKVVGSMAHISTMSDSKLLRGW